MRPCWIKVKHLTYCWLTKQAQSKYSCTPSYYCSAYSCLSCYTGSYSNIYCQIVSSAFVLLMRGFTEHALVFWQSDRSHGENGTDRKVCVCVCVGWQLQGVNVGVFSNWLRLPVANPDGILTVSLPRLCGETNHFTVTTPLSTSLPHLLPVNKRNLLTYFRQQIAMGISFFLFFSYFLRLFIKCIWCVRIVKVSTWFLFPPSSFLWSFIFR